MSIDASKIETLSAADRARIDRREIVVETCTKNIPTVWAFAKIAAPAQRIWQLIDDVANYPRSMPGVKKADVISRDGDKVRVRITIDTPFPLPNLSSVTDGMHIAEAPDRFERSWTLVEGDYEHNAGRWLIVADQGADSATVLYQLAVKPRIKVPRKLQGFAQQRALPKLFQHLRSQLE